MPAWKITTHPVKCRMELLINSQTPMAESAKMGKMIIDFIPHFIMHVTACPCRDKSYPILNKMGPSWEVETLRVERKDQLVLYSQYDSCWHPEDPKGQVIYRHDIELNFSGNSCFSTKKSVLIQMIWQHGLADGCAARQIKTRFDDVC